MKRVIVRSSVLATGSLIAAIALAAPGAASAQAGMPGEGVYKERCASCHDNAAANRAPTRENLAAMSFETIHYALTDGKMKGQGTGLSEDQRVQLITFLTGKNREAATTDWTRSMMCAAGKRPVDLSKPTVVGFGFDHHNSRTLTAAQAGLTKAQLSNLDLAWSIAIPGATEMRSQPAIVGTTIFLPAAQAGAIYALDVADPMKPCVRWVFKTHDGSQMRTNAAYGVIEGGRGVVVISGFDTTVYALDAKTGKPIWAPRKVGSYSWSMNTGTATVLKDRIIVPVSQNEISNAANIANKCCDNHGYILSLDPKTGAQQWRYDTMQEAKPLRDRGDGKMLWGPAGAPIWNSPVVDEKRGLIYFGTGEANAPPAHKNTDALIAISLKDGHEVWSMQATANDIYNIGCGPNPRPGQFNCVRETVFRDVDFGASTILGHMKRGVDVVYGGQKSGTVWALAPDTGQLLWRRDLGTGSALGGVHWGMAFYNDTIFVPISQVGRTIPTELPVDPGIKSGLYALDATTGATKWNAVSTPDCSGDRPQRMRACQTALGFSTAATVIDGAVVAAALDGYIHIYDAETGKELWKYDTAKSYHGINGVDGKGGAIDAASITAGDGFLIANSGYGSFGQQAGNMILFFRARPAARN
ncbi:MAG TPA: PQQ-binding-like beta-propeller repeat protein [Caulobacteraceae bacterium]|nr:PQQ-binding-like beta-propeller repeat protein [Caulobacteraceae bacterium]